MTRKILYLLFSLFLLSCSKKEVTYEPTPRLDPYQVYKDAYTAFEKGDYFFAEKKFNGEITPLLNNIKKVFIRNIIPTKPPIGK